jgi:hypothetical protein
MPKERRRAKGLLLEEKIEPKGRGLQSQGGLTKKENHIGGRSPKISMSEG